MRGGRTKTQNQNHGGFPINCCGLKRGKKNKIPEGPLGLEMAFLSAGTWMDLAPRAGALSKGKNKFQKVLDIELGNT